MATTMPPPRKILALVLAGTAVALTGAVVFEGGPNAVIYPKQRIPLDFDHEYHVRAPDEAKNLKGEALSCTFCHENVSDQADPGATDIPGHAVCESCHADWIGTDAAPAPTKECARCHKDLRPTAAGAAVRTSTRAAKMSIPVPNIKFGHAEHVAADLECVACHGNVPKKALATRDDFPTMDRCIECHQEKGISTECKSCHLTGATGRLVTDFPSGELMPLRYHGSAVHTGDFVRAHAAPAQRDPNYCKQCHGTEDCMECHDSVGRDTRYHPGDWLAVHSIKSRIDDVRCTSCHRQQTFCLDCHVRSGVATIVAVNSPATITRQTVRKDTTGAATGPHPMAADGWLSPASKNFHGFHANRAMNACASCHQEQYCVRCHGSAFGGRPNLGQKGGNPHGPNPERLKGSAARNNNARACLKCHSPYDASWR
jgi:hypothetical protein